MWLEEDTPIETSLLSVLLLAMTVILATLLWPVNRWVMKRGAAPEGYGLWTSIMAAVISAAFALAFGQPLNQPAVWAVGAMIGFAFAVGYCLIIMHCLKIGPTGPTAAVNNMGLVWPVVVGLVWPQLQQLSAGVVVGLALVVIALVLFGIGSSAGSGDPAVARISRHWVAWVFLGWLLSGMSMTGQYIGSVVAADSPLALTAAFYAVATLILAPLVLRRGRAWINRVELTGGLVNGVLSAAALVTTLSALRYARVEIVYPVTVATPILLVLVLSSLVYRERLSRTAWAACAAGVAGLVVLSLSR